MYIQYTSIDLASLLIYQVSRVILLQWLFPLLQKHLVSGLGSTLGFFTRAAAELPFHEVSLLALALLETSGFTNHQQLMLLLDFYFRGVKHREYLKGSSYLSLICYSSSQSSSSLVAMTLEKHHYLIWKINSHSIQVIVVLRQSEPKLNDWAFLH